MSNQLQESKSGNKLLALLVGILMNPILLAMVIWADSPLTSNEWLHGKPLLERTPFAYVFFWAGAFLPKTSDYFAMSLLLAVMGNTILYSALTYFALTLLGSSRNGLK